MKGVFTGMRGVLWGPESKVQRCLARTRRGTPCQRPAEVNPLTGRRTRCRFHGGLAGCRTDEGKARISAANTKHGRFSKVAKEKRAIELKAKRDARVVRRAELAHLHAENTQLKQELALELRKRRSDRSLYVSSPPVCR
jgi:hypothetical protein